MEIFMAIEKLKWTFDSNKAVVSFVIFYLFIFIFFLAAFGERPHHDRVEI